MNHMYTQLVTFFLEMLSTNFTNFDDSNNSNILSSTSVSCWPALEPSLNRLFPSIPPSDSTQALPALDSDDYLKLYTLVFEYCVGVGAGEDGSNKKGGRVVGLNVSGEELYRTIVKYLFIRFTQWSHSLKVRRVD